jgi:bifunctional non-homologous end joining protein LigD
VTGPDEREPLAEYRRRRDPARTGEPVPEQGEPLPRGNDDTFVVQEHHARALHWDFRLERGGVLVSWAIPKGLPEHPSTNHLALHTEDHPLEYAGFTGDIAAGEYGGGKVALWDRGRYECEKWTDREVKVVLHGGRVQGRYVLFATGRGDRDWMIHRMDPPSRPDWLPLPDRFAPMLAGPGRLPSATDDAAWAYEFDWAGVRALARVEGGRLHLLDADGVDLTRSFPELRAPAQALGARPVFLDGELVALDEQGHPDPDVLRRRLETTEPGAARRLAARAPVVYLVVDVLHLDGRPLLDQPYDRRRDLLDGLGVTGPAFRVAPSFTGGGAAVLDAARENGLTGVVAKRRESPYRPGERSRDWRTVRVSRSRTGASGRR